MATAKKAAKPPKPEQPQPDPTAVLIDELGNILLELAAPEAQEVLRKAARAEFLKKAVRAAVPASAPGNQPFQKDGSVFRALFGLCGNQTIIDYSGLVERIGAAEYSKFAKATKTQLEENVTPGILALYLRTEQTGTRSLNVVPRGVA